MKLLGIFIIYLLLLRSSVHAQTPAPIPTQTTTGPCSPIFNGNGNTQNCNTTPPSRVFTNRVANLAVVELKKYAGANLQFLQIGGSTEINEFASNIASLFTLAKWKVEFSSAAEYRDNERGVITKGEGVRCGGQGPAFESAKKALALVGYPCVGAPLYSQDLKSTAIIVHVGTRIIPAE